MTKTTKAFLANALGETAQIFVDARPFGLGWDVTLARFNARGVRTHRKTREFPTSDAAREYANQVFAALRDVHGMRRTRPPADANW